MQRFARIADAGDAVFAIFMDVGAKEIKKRFGGRRVCGCGASYHTDFNPPKKKNICDLCGARIYTREDDKPKIISERIKFYKKESAPLINYWRRSGKLIEINGEENIKKINADLIKKINKALKK